MKFNKGQIAVWATIAGSVIVAIIGGYFGQSNRTDAALEVEKNDRISADTALIQRTAIVETKMDNVEKKVDEVRSDVKEILKRLPK